MSTTKEDIACWMIKQFDDQRTISQYAMVTRIKKTFGPEWVYKNENGNPAIHKGVLAEFRKLHNGSIVWDKSYRQWKDTRNKEN
ncbi:DUF6953 family protein [Rhodococcus aetherivorans]|uniref:DUF6953 family protein n=1 Tax=Rhodococcus aetherivorans TaxID=191292 RepID=UPI00388F2636